jgi:thiol-disulfide isomerase/thioredoxin
MNRRDFNFACCAWPLPTLAGAQTAEGPGAPIEWPPILLLDGSTLAPASWRGQAAVVVFWETFCPFCKRQNAHLNKLFRATQGQTQREGQRLRILGVALDADEQAVRRYMKANDYAFPVAMDGGQLRQRLTSRRVIPMTCVLDAQGRLVQALAGEMFEEDVMAFARLAS